MGVQMRLRRYGNRHGGEIAVWITSVLWMPSERQAHSSRALLKENEDTFVSMLAKHDLALPL
jgi:hypothetical protein